MKDRSPDASTTSKRPLREFLGLFRSYGTAMAALVACTPVVTQALNVLPSFEAHDQTLSFFGTFAAVLSAALLFSLRHLIGAYAFPSRGGDLLPGQSKRRNLSIAVPIVFAAASLGCLYSWQDLMTRSITSVALDFAVVETDSTDGTAPAVPLSLRKALDEANRVAARLPWGSENHVLGEAEDVKQKDGTFDRRKSVQFTSEATVQAVLSQAPSHDIPWLIVLSYVGMFVFATMTFVWLGLLEFAQEKLGLDDRDLLASPFREARHRLFALHGVKVVADVGGDGDPGRGGSDDSLSRQPLFRLYLKTAPGEVELLGGPEGPLCDRHELRLHSLGMGPDDFQWRCDYAESVDGKTKRKTHWLSFDMPNVDVQIEAEKAAQAQMEGLRKLYAEKAVTAGHPPPGGATTPPNEAG